MFKYEIITKGIDGKKVFIEFEEDQILEDVLMKAVEEDLIEGNEVKQADVSLIEVPRDVLIELLSDCDDMDSKTAYISLEEHQKQIYGSCDNASLMEVFESRFENYFEGQSKNLSVNGDDIDSIWEKLLLQIGEDLMHHDSTALYELLKFIDVKYLKGYLSER